MLRRGRPLKTVTQSGRGKLGGWTLAFKNQERWENPLMGWFSSADPAGHVTLKFDTKEQAVAYAENYGACCVYKVLLPYALAAMLL